MKYLIFLRGINVGGHRRVLMADLKKLFNDLGFNNVSTYIQSGNVLFETTKDKQDIETSVTEGIANTFGFEVPVIVISLIELQSLLSKNPYTVNTAIKRLHVIFLKDLPSKELIDKIKESDFTPDLFKVVENYVFLNIEDKYHKSKLSNNFFERQLNVNATTRNWKTINKLIEISEKLQE